MPAKGAEVWTNIPVLALLAANVVPLVGVLFLNWSAVYIVLLYWAENLAVGFYNVLKMAFVKVKHPAEHLGKLFLIPFFIIHYGMFTAIHGFFVVAIFSKDNQGPPMDDATWPCFFAFIQIFAGFIKHIMMSVPPAVRLAFLTLFISHGVSFVYNYFLKGEYARTNPRDLMGQPYVRVFVMHITILGGGFLSMILGSPAALLLVLVLLKTAIDVKFHLLEHKKAAKKN